MKDRIKLIMDKYKLNSKEFAEKIDVTPSNISHILSGRSQPSFMIMNNIALSFPDISMDWLITGNGNIHKNSIIPTEPDMHIGKDLFDINENIQEEHVQAINIEKEDNSEQKDKGDKNINISNLNRITTKKSHPYRIALFYEDGRFEFFDN